MEVHDFVLFSTKNQCDEVDGSKHPQKWFFADFARGIGYNRVLSHVAEIEFQQPSISLNKKKRKGKFEIVHIFSDLQTRGPTSFRFFRGVWV